MPVTELSVHLKGQLADTGKLTSRPDMQRIATTSYAHPLHKWIANGDVVCPLCKGTLSVDEDASCSLCGTRFPIRQGVINLLTPSPQAPLQPLPTEKIAAAILARYGLPEAECGTVEKLIRDSFAGHGDAVLAGEIRSFVDRFHLTNQDYELRVVHHYLDSPLLAGRTDYRSIRIRNAGLFPWSSRGTHPLLLSYHWSDATGNIVVFEGCRTSFPIDVAPGREITIPVQLQAPTEPGSYVLTLLLVHEMVCWAEHSAVLIPVKVTSEPGDVIAPVAVHSAEVLAPWSEAEDSAIAIRFVQQFCAARLADRQEWTMLEIGGGNSPEMAGLLEHFPEASCLSIDVSDALLQLRALQLRHHQPSLNARMALMTADANHLPLQPGFADLIFLCRALHHFPDPARLLRELRRVLKPSGVVALVCEPVGAAYDDETRRLLQEGVNEQVFALEDYLTMFRRAGLNIVIARCDWGFSLKTILSLP